MEEPDYKNELKKLRLALFKAGKLSYKRTPKKLLCAKCETNVIYLNGLCINCYALQ